jgi:hypothetical protein
MSYFTNFFETEHNVKLALEHMLKMHYPSYDVRTIVQRVVSSGGAISGTALKQEMLKASYSVYQEAKGFEGIIIMDDTITKFLYINTADNMAQSASSLIAKFPSWTDVQSNCMKVTLAKRTASPAVRAASTATAATAAPATPVPVENTGRTRRRPV